ncbi:MAG: cell division topological specificity factor MinE [Candidatus Gastranaerophilales bacterium]|nr:cell division topological specificity factor MinE [Candidatus Gastranaerophilales bacterium]
MKLLNDKLNEKINVKVNEMVNEIVSRCNKILASNNIIVKKSTANSKNDACNRLKLVLMHDRSKLDPGTMEKMRDELMDVISRYVEIDKEALDLNLESEANTIALIANIPILRSK